MSDYQSPLPEQDVQDKRIFRLYKICDIPRVKLFFWFYMPEFVDRIVQIDPTYRTVTREDVLRIVKEIYEIKVRENDPDFSFPRARRTIRALEKRIAEGSRVPVH